MAGQGEDTRHQGAVPRGRSGARRVAWVGLALLTVVALGAAGWVGWPVRWAYQLPVGEPLAVEVVHATGTTLLVDGRRFTARPAPESLAVTHGGLFYLSDGVLYRWSRGGSERVADVGAGSLKATADGRYLAFIDREHGPLNLMRHRVAQTVVVDTATGAEVVRDTAGNGDRWAVEDLADLYPEAEPKVLGFDEEAVYAVTAQGNDVYRWDLSSGARSNLGDQAHPATPNRPGGERVLFDLHDGAARVSGPEVEGRFSGRRFSGRASPSGDRVVHVDGRGDVVVRRLLERAQEASAAPGGRSEGEAVRFSAARGSRFVLGGWLDEDRFVAVLKRSAAPGGGEASEGSVDVVTCEVSTRTCRSRDGFSRVRNGRLPVLPFGLDGHP